MINDSEFGLDALKLTEADWKTLEDYNEVLQVRFCVQKNMC
jgi:hypothetical protein